MSRRDGC